MSSNPTAAPRRLLLCGAGRVVERYYAPALLRSPDFRVEAVVDPSPERRTWASTTFAAPAYGSIDEALAAHAFGAALVVTPPQAQPDLVLALLSRGLPVLVEKPGALSIAEAGRLVTAADSLPLRMALVRRYWQRYERLKQRLGGKPDAWSIELETNPGAWGHVDGAQASGIEGLIYDLLPHAYDIAVSSLGAGLSEPAGGALADDRVTLWFDSARTQTISIRHGDTYIERVTAQRDGRSFASEPSQVASIAERLAIRARLQRPEQEVAFDRLLASFADDLRNGVRNDDLIGCAELIERVKALGRAG